MIGRRLHGDAPKIPCAGGGRERRAELGDEKSRKKEDGGGDLVEEAGETTAADMVEGPADTRPVGEGTKAKVAGDPDTSEG